MRAIVAMASDQVPTATEKPLSLFQRIALPSVLILGLVLSAAWAALLAYGVVVVVAKAI